MRFPLVACVALLFVQAPASAQWCYFGPVCAPPCVPYELRPVVTYQAQWREEKVPCVLQKVSYQPQVNRVKVTTWALQEYNQQVRRSYYTPVPREVQRDVATWCWVPAVMFDPCTCCCIVSWCPQRTVTRISCIEYDYRREDRDEMVRMCRWVPQESYVDQVCLVPQVTQEPGWTVRRYCVMVPCQTWVWVPCGCGW
jgi:hypothetical protein